MKVFCVYILIFTLYANYLWTIFIDCLLFFYVIKKLDQPECIYFIKIYWTKKKKVVKIDFLIVSQMSV